jgi:hypothetical protein
MRRLIKPIFWTFLFLVMMLIIDQFLVQVPPVHPAHAAVSDFYQDFRGRLIDLTFGEKKAPTKTIEAVIENQKSQEKGPQQSKKAEQKQEVVQKPTEPTTQPLTEKSPRYLYSDGKGELHFVDSLDEVPDEYRGQAQPMGK